MPPGIRRPLPPSGPCPSRFGGTALLGRLGRPLGVGPQEGASGAVDRADEARPAPGRAQGVLGGGGQEEALSSPPDRRTRPAEEVTSGARKPPPGT